MIVSLIVFISIVYVISALLGYLFHKLFHQKWAGFLATSHMVHHMERYPPEDLVSDAYRHAGKHTTILLFVPVVITALLITGLIGYIGLVSPLYSLIGAVEILIISYMHNALHDAFHVKNSLWHKVPGFKSMQNHHFTHHFQMDKNFGIFDFTWDRVFKTFEIGSNQPKQ